MMKNHQFSSRDRRINNPDKNRRINKHLITTIQITVIIMIRIMMIEAGQKHNMAKMYSITISSPKKKGKMMRVTKQSIDYLNLNTLNNWEIDLSSLLHTEGSKGTMENT